MHKERFTPEDIPLGVSRISFAKYAGVSRSALTRYFNGGSMGSAILGRITVAFEMLKRRASGTGGAVLLDRENDHVEKDYAAAAPLAVVGK